MKPIRFGFLLVALNLFFIKRRPADFKMMAFSSAGIVNYFGRGREKNIRESSPAPMKTLERGCTKLQELGGLTNSHSLTSFSGNDIGNISI